MQFFFRFFFSACNMYENAHHNQMKYNMTEKKMQQKHKTYRET
jgi:hypothetical protein